MAVEHSLTFQHYEWSDVGLIVQVEPQDLSSLHLLDANLNDVFDWNVEKHYTPGQKLLNYLKAYTLRKVKLR